MELYLSFLKTYIFGAWFNYIYLAVLSLLVIVNGLYFILKNFRFWYKKSLSFAILLLFVLTFGEFLITKRIFTAIDGCFIFFFSVTLLQLAVYYFLVPLKAKKKSQTKKVEISEIKNDYGLSVKRAVEHIKTAEETPQVFSGYVDVGYIKSLINTLKGNDLTESDLLELEDLEVYLLNFVNRQPSNAERQELSAKLGGLIKKLAKYA